jgi:hypothetical protein
MSNPFEKVSPGDPLSVPAQLQNTLIEMAQAYLRGEFRRPKPARRAGDDYNVIFIRNDSGADVDRFGVLAITDAAILPSESLAAFQADTPLAGDIPTPADLGRFAILLGPIGDGQTGLALAAGVAVVQVDDGDGSTDFADVADGVTDSLEGNSAGAARILWRAAGRASSGQSCDSAGPARRRGNTRIRDT